MTNSVGAMEPDMDERLDLGHYIAILRRRWLWLLAPILIVTGLSAALNLSQPDTFSSRARVLLTASDAGQVLEGGVVNPGIANRELENEIAFANSDVVKALVVEELGSFPDGLRVSSTDSADVLQFSAAAPTAELAAERANVWANAFVQAKQEQAIGSTRDLIATFRGNLDELGTNREELRSDLNRIEDDLAVATDPAQISQLERDRDREERRIQFQIDLIDTEVAAITRGITELSINGELIATGNIQVTQVASVPLNRTNSPLYQSLILGIFAGTMLGVGAAFLRNSLDQAIKSSSDINAMGLPVLGSIPRPARDVRESMDRVLADHPHSPQAEGILEIRASLQYLAMSQDLTSILVTSANAGEGKTVTTANLALSMAYLDQVTLAADVDLRRPRLHATFGHNRTPGLVDHFLSDIPMEDLVHHESDLSPNLYFVAAGTATARPGDVLATQQFLNTLMTLEKQADVVLMDGPPVLPVADPQALARSADAAVLCVRAGKTRKNDVKAAIDKLNKAGANVVGVVLTDVPKDRSYRQYEQEFN